MGVLVPAIAGLAMMIFEIVEAAVIDPMGGNMLGFTLVLQTFSFALGLAIFVLSSSLWMTDYRRDHFPTRHISLKL